MCLFNTFKESMDRAESILCAKYNNGTREMALPSNDAHSLVRELDINQITPQIDEKS